MDKNNIRAFTVRNAKFAFNTNFEGREERYNNAGNRNVSIRIDDEDLRAQLIEDGWNVKTWISKTAENPDPVYYLELAISYRFEKLAPKIYKVTRNNAILLDEDMVGQLDTEEIENVDVTIRPRVWFDDRTGTDRVKAYVQEMYVTISESELAQYYAARFSNEDEM